MNKLTNILLFLCGIFGVHAQNFSNEDYALIENLPYIEATDTNAYRQERCRLDIYYPLKIKDFPTVVWFHGGGLEGGYLTLMIGLDKQYLAAYGIDAGKIRGLIPVSGQTNTHYTIRKERGLPRDIPVIDEYAPINHVRENVPPTLLITGDRNLEMLARYEENLHLEAIMKSLGNTVELFELQGFDHGNVVVPACELIVRFVQKR